MVGKKSPNKDGDSDGNRSDICDAKSDNGDSDSGVSTGDGSGDCAVDDSGSPMVPDAVMKSVIAELKKFENDPLKSKKLRKKMKAERKKEKKLSSQMQSIVMNGAYDMISPPNQVLPGTMATRLNASKFNHAKVGSAFGVPKETGNRVPMFWNNPHSAMGLLMPSPSHQNTRSPSSSRRDSTSGSDTNAAVNNQIDCDLPVLSDLLSNSKSTPANTHDISRSTDSTGSPLNNSYTTGRECRYDQFGHQHYLPSPMTSLSRVYPFPFIAESPMALHSLRHFEPCRPHAQYPAQEGHHMFQPYTVSPLQNPYYTSPSSLLWANHASTDRNGSYVHI